VPNFTLNSGTTAEKLAKTIRGLLFFAAPCSFFVDLELFCDVDFGLRSLNDNLRNGAEQRDSYSGRLLRNHVWPIKWKKISITLKEPEGHFCHLKPFQHLTKQ